MGDSMAGKAFLLATTAFVAGIGAAGAQHPSPLHAGGYVHRFVSTTPRGSQTLYDQNKNDAGVVIVSWFDDSDFASYDSQGADDFTVPGGSVWTVTKVDVTGQYFNGPGPAEYENVYFYKDRKGKPDRLIKQFSFLHGADSNGSFAITLPEKGVRLKAGKYWLSVVGVTNFGSGAGEWGWEINGRQRANLAMWQNPPGGFGICQTWAPVETCLGYGPDLMFALKGKSKSVAAD